jgi:hypothetical protein
MIIKIATGNNYSTQGEKLTIESLDKNTAIFQYKQIRKIESGHTCDWFWTITITSMQGNVWEYRFKNEDKKMYQEILNWWYQQLSKPKPVQIKRRFKYATARN